MKKTVAISLVVLVCVGLFGAGIANTVISGTGSLTLLISAVVGGIVTIIAVASVKKKYAVQVGLAFALLSCIAFFFFSGTVDHPIGEWSVVERGNQISLYNGWGMTCPYTGAKVYWIDKDFGIKTEGVLQTRESSVQWAVSADFERADYDEFFTLIRQAGGFNEWRAEVKQVFQEVVDAHIAQFTPEQVLPSHFSWDFSDEQVQTLASLGAKPTAGGITAKGMEVILH